MRKKVINICGICMLPFFAFFIFFFLAPGFGFHTIPIIISQCMLPITLGLAMAGVMMTGLMDFTPGARVVLAALCGAVGANAFGILGLILGAMAGGLIGGFFIAVLYRYLKIPSMVVSLGAVLVMEAASDKFAQTFAGSGNISVDASVSVLGSYPYNVIWAAVGCFILYFIIYKTKFGCLIAAAGNDEAMLKNMGVNVNQVKFKAFAASGIFCFMGGILQLCYSGSVQAITNMGTMTMVFKPMMGVIIGLQLVRLVNNIPLMIVIGEIVIQIIFNGFIAMGLTDNIQNIVLGIILLIVMAVSANTETFVESRRKFAVRQQARA